MIQGAAGAVEPLVVLAVAAAAADLDHGPVRREAGSARGGANPARQFVVVDMLGLAAAVADQEDAVVQAVGMIETTFSSGLR